MLVVVVPTVSPTCRRADLYLVFRDPDGCQAESHRLLDIGQQEIVDEEEELVGPIGEMTFVVPST